MIPLTSAQFKDHQELVLREIARAKRLKQNKKRYRALHDRIFAILNYQHRIAAIENMQLAAATNHPGLQEIGEIFAQQIEQWPLPLPEGLQQAPHLLDETKQALIYRWLKLVDELGASS